MSEDNPAETYESYMVPALFAPSAERLLAGVELRAGAGQRVLDVGCGTGVVARRAAALLGAGADVTGVDASPHMLAVARAASEREGVRIAFCEGRAEQLPFADHRFDLVTCQFALMFFADRPAALRELRRVCKPGGQVAVAVFAPLERHPFYLRLHEVIRARAGISALEQIFALGDPAALRALFADAGFSAIDLDEQTLTARFPDPDAFLAGEIAVDTAAIPAMQQLTASERAKLTAALAADMAAPLREHVHDGHVVLEFHTLHIRARA